MCHIKQQIMCTRAVIWRRKSCDTRLHLDMKNSYLDMTQISWNAKGTVSVIWNPETLSDKMVSFHIFFILVSIQTPFSAIGHISNLKNLKIDRCCQKKSGKCLSKKWVRILMLVEFDFIRKNGQKIVFCLTKLGGRISDES